MKIEDVKTLQDIKNLKEQAKKEIELKEEDLKQLEEAYKEKLLSKDEYNKELTSIKKAISQEETKLKELVEIENAYNNVLTDQIALHNLNDINVRSSQGESEVQAEITARKAEINKYSKKLTPALIEAIKEEVIGMFKENEKLEEESKSSNVRSESLSENQIATLEREAAKLIAEMKSIRDNIAVVEDKEELKELKEYLDKKANELDKIFSILTTPFAEEIRRLYREETLEEKEKLNKDGLSPEAINDTDRIDKEIEELREEAREYEKQRKDSIIRFKKIFNEERINQEQNGPFELEEYKEYFEYYTKLKEEEDVKLKEVTKKLKKINNKIKKLERDKKEIRRYSLEAASLEISYLEYMKIVKILEKNKKKLLTKLYEKKGLGSVIHKRGGRTKEERKLLLEARNEIFREIIKYQEKADKLKSIEEIINILADEDYSKVIRAEKPTPIKISTQQKDTIEENLGIILTVNGNMVINGDVNITINNGVLDTVIRPANVKPEPPKKDIPDAKIDEEEDKKKQKPKAPSKPKPDMRMPSGGVIVPTIDDKEKKKPPKEDPGMIVPPGPTVPLLEDKHKKKPPKDDPSMIIPSGPTVPLLEDKHKKKPSDDIEPTDTNKGFDDATDANISILEPTDTNKGFDDPTDTNKGHDSPTDTNITHIDPVPPTGSNKGHEDEPSGPNIPTPEPPEEERTPKRGIREIIGDIRKGYEIGRKDGQRYARANLHVTQSFLNEMHSGDYLYNIVHFVPGLAKASVSLVQKVSGILTTSHRVKDLMKNMAENIDNLSDEDLDTLWKEFRGNFITQERYPQALVMVIQEKMHEYAMGRVEAINFEITQAYRQIFSGKTIIEEIDRKLKDPSLDANLRQHYTIQKQNVLKEMVANIDLIREKRLQGEELLTGGLHGLDEDINARFSKMNYVGRKMRAKEYDLDRELEDQLMEYEKAENKARAISDDNGIVEAFINQELLLENSTEISEGFFGKYTSGKKQFTPLVKALDYREDPFWRDLFTTIALTTAAVGAVRAVNVHKAAQEHAARVDQANAQLEQNVQAKGQELVNHSSAYRRGMQAQSNEDVLAASNSLEREALDRSTLESGRWMGGDYSKYDLANHKLYESFNDTTQQALSDIANKYANHQITQVEALKEMAQLQQQTQSTLQEVLIKCNDTLQKYRLVKPQFDLDAPEITMQYLIHHANSINDMNQAMLESVQIGEELLGVNAEMVGQLPSDMLTTLAACTSSALLAFRVFTTMSEKHPELKTRDAVTDMFEVEIERMNQQEEAEEEKETGRSR